MGDRNEASLRTTVAFLLKEKVRERTIPLGNHEDLAPNLHLCKKHDSDLLKKEKGQRCSPLVPRRDTVAAKSTRKSSESPLRFCAWSQRGSVASLLKGRAQSLLSARSSTSLSAARGAALHTNTLLSRGAAAAAALWCRAEADTAVELIPVVLFTCVQQ